MRFAAFFALLLSSTAALGQFELDGVWTTWSVTSDLDPRVNRPPYLPPIKFRWRRIVNPYRCEVEFQNPGTTARDFKYALRYGTGVEITTSKKHSGSLTGVTGTSIGRVTVAECYRVAPLIIVQGTASSIGSPSELNRLLTLISKSSDPDWTLGSIPALRAAVAKGDDINQRIDDDRTILDAANYWLGEYQEMVARVTDPTNPARQIYAEFVQKQQRFITALREMGAKTSDELKRR